MAIVSLGEDATPRLSISTARQARPQGPSSLRARKLWKTVRDTLLLPADDEGVFGMDLASATTQASTIKVGLQQKYSLAGKKGLVAFTHHSRVPRRHIEALLAQQMLAKSSLHGAVCKANTAASSSVKPRTARENASEADPDTSAKQLQNASNTSFLCIDGMGLVHIWDAVSDSSSRPSLVLPITASITSVVLISSLYMYATSSHDCIVRFFDCRFHEVSMFTIPCAAHELLYNGARDELITIGDHTITTWSVKKEKIRDKVEITLAPQWSITTNLPSSQWLGATYLDGKSQRLFAAAGAGYIIYDLRNKREVIRTSSSGTRQIRSLAYCDNLDYTVCGCSDGSIAIRDINTAVVETTHAHTRAVTGLAVYQPDLLVVSCSMDMTIKMHSLCSFQEVYSYQATDPLLSLTFLDDSQISVSSPDSLLVFDFNHFQRVWHNSRSVISNLGITAESPRRIVARLEDGTIRIIGTGSGDVITSSLPSLDTDDMKAMAHSKQLACLFLLLQSGDFWILKTDVHPCTVVEIWTSLLDARDKCCCIAVLEFDPTRGSSIFLIAGSQGGRVVVIGRHGHIYSISQVHGGQVEACQAIPPREPSDHGLIITSSHDCTVKLSQLSIETGLLHPHATINTTAVPRHISWQSDTLCFGGDDGCINMFFLKPGGTTRPIRGHNKADDHADGITGISAIEKLDLFVTCGNDGTIRVWDSYNSLLREMQLDEPIHGLCVVNSRGDIVVAVRDRLDLLPFSSYLPPGYCKTAQLLESNIAIEETIPFDETPQLSIPKRFTFTLDEQRPWSVADANLVEACTATAMTTSTGVNLAQVDPVGDAVDLLACESLDDSGKAVNVLASDPSRFVLYSRRGTMVSRQETVVNATEMAILAVAADKILLRSASTKQSDGPWKDLQPFDVAQNYIPSIKKSTKIIATESLESDFSVPVAPDGELPNSRLLALIHDYCLQHNYRMLGNKPRRPTIQVTKDERLDSANRGSGKTNPTSSSVYRDRLRLLIQALPTEEAMKKATSQEMELVDSADSVHLTKVKIYNRQHDLRKPPPFPHFERAVKEKDDALKAALAQDWFPRHLVYASKESLSEGGSGADHELIVQPSADGILPAVLHGFEQADSSFKQFQVLNFVDLLQEKFSLCNFAPTVQSLSKHLATKLISPLARVEIDCRIAMMDKAMSWNHTVQSGDVVVALVLQLGSPYERIKSAATGHLEKLGLSQEAARYLSRNMVQDMYDRIEESARRINVQSPVNNRRTSIVPKPAAPAPSRKGSYVQLTPEQMEIASQTLKSEIQAMIKSALADKESLSALSDIVRLSAPPANPTTLEVIQALEVLVKSHQLAKASEESARKLREARI
ncbi:hypothetical protein SeMB42_g00218 [Synchytrium endobioticum]|uniref:Uncharacterized protein n=1 Tax=Synchytrium endobioticum TaxID=286115 RepID=A0A507DUI6_9FUNG|nr:hypothetical protein SeMB42_g00218 [Synchytrium endobioticum]